MGAGWGELVEMICPTGKAENILTEDWTGGIALNRLNKFDFTRNTCRHTPCEAPPLHGALDRLAVGVLAYCAMTDANPDENQELPH